MNTAVSTPNPTLQNPAPPAWFVTQRENQGKAAPPSKPGRPETARSVQPGVSISTPPVSSRSSRELTWLEKLKLYVRGPEVKAYGISFLAHVLILFCLSLFAIHHYQSQQTNSPLLAGESEELSFNEEVIDTRADFLKGAEQELDLIQPVMETAEVSEIVLPELQTDSFIQPESKGEGEQISLEGLPFSQPIAGKVITKGNFSAWTVPADPEPLQSYLILIQVKLPKSLKKYERGDLSGEVFGTDGYWQSITVMSPREGSELLPLEKGIAQLIVAVPGAVELVEDRINIKSKRLKEKQTLKIEF
ncbi:hypothetical protein Pla110_30430 [Polystyrenella longa]|uniref:Uncharacterized protein n=1 Tax=Polystyrenella longa TaxID=2528007 RepID=A0A518CQ01_9PLAN|nr:hypothetical protein [Polystyrenella longa]QDU81302.1 hypothetical protein Pla110_30430 [Polystyrenella longa]